MCFFQIFRYNLYRCWDRGEYHHTHKMCWLKTIVRLNQRETRANICSNSRKWQQQWKNWGWISLFFVLGLGRCACDQFLPHFIQSNRRRKKKIEKKRVRIVRQCRISQYFLVIDRMNERIKKRKKNRIKEKTINRYTKKNRSCYVKSWKLLM